MFTLFKSTKLSALAAIYNECLPAAALFETLFRLSMSLSRRRRRLVSAFWYS